MAKLFAVGIGGSSQLLGELGQVPAHWSRLPISAFGEVVTGTTPKTSERRYYEGGDIAFLAPGDLGYTTRLYTAAKHITREGLLVSRALPKGSTCFVCIGSSIGKVGVTVDEESSTNQQINAIVPSSSFEPMFVCYLLQYFAKYIASHASPSPVPIMSKGQFQQIELVAPSERSEQREIAEILEAIDASIEAHERELKQLQLLFEYLLGRLMTGEIRVRKLEIDVSSVT